jgi:hypothetical protein
MRAHARAGRLHARGLLHGEVNEQRSGEVERGEEIEIGGDAEMIE